MYYLDHRRDVVRVPPERLGPSLENVLTELAQQQFEGKLFDGQNLTVMIQGVRPIGEGHIIHGDGGVYQEVEYDSLVFRPEIQEVVEGSVVEIRKFGAFVRFGPLDGLLHVSQIMDDRVNIDEHNQRLVGVETKRDLKVGYKVRARVVSLSLSEISPRDSRIGLTMRQPGLGRLEWVIDAHKKADEKSGKRPAKKEAAAKPAAPAPKAAAPAAKGAPAATKSAEGAKAA
jgi:DNA-directed RNA polymerase subunit E'